MWSSGLRARLGVRHLVVGALALIVVAVATLALLSGRSPSGPAPEGRSLGAQAPGFSLASLQSPGSTVALGSPDGRVTVITFFASWCTDCRKDIGVLADTSRHLGRTVRFVGVDVADTRSAALTLVRSAHLDYPVGVDPERKVSILYQIPGLPSAVFVNGTGHVVGDVVGAITKQELMSWVQRAEA